MSLENENGMVMPVAPMYGGGYGGNSGFGGWGGDGWWIILLFILLGNNGWGGFGGFGGMGGFAADGAALYPWMNQAEITSDGFRDQMINNNITGIRDSIGDISTQLCNGFASVNAGVASGFAAAEQSANARQIANMQQAFNAQTAVTSGLTGISSQLAQCCCDNRLATNDLKYTIATENCADRAALSDGVRDIIANQTSGIQRILDQLCQDKIDAKNDEIANLRQQIAMKDLAASQVAQNAFIQQGFTNEVDQLYNRLNTCPVPTTPVYGRTPIFSCNTNACGCNTGCGCSM